MLNLSHLAKARRNYEVTLERKRCASEVQNSRPLQRETVRAYTADEAKEMISAMPRYKAFIISRIVERP